MVRNQLHLTTNLGRKKKVFTSGFHVPWFFVFEELFKDLFNATPKHNMKNNNVRLSTI